MKNNKLQEVFLIVVSVMCCLFYIYTSIYGQITELIHRATLLMCGLIIVFVKNPMTKKDWKWTRWIDCFLVILSVIICAYMIVFERDIIIRSGQAQPWEWYLGLVLILLLFEASRRTLGLAMPILSVCSLLYAFYGRSMPTVIAHRGFAPRHMLSTIFLTLEGIWGTCMAVASNVIVYFIIFTAFLAITGANDAFLKLANALMGGVRGGPAKMAVVASAIFGTISGSSAANVAGTGSITIPLMKKTGYKPEFAGAVEAVASTGGQIMPPIMGSAAFIMAEVLGIKYTTVCLAAIIPAVLYYISVFFMVELEARKNGLEGLPKDQVPDLKETLGTWWPVLIPLFLLIALLIMQYSPSRAALLSLIALLIVSCFRKETRMTPRKFIDAMVNAATDMAPITIVCAVAGIIIGVLGRTGLGTKIANVIITVSGGNLMTILVLTMIASIIMGMGMPTVACYILLALSVAPAIANTGVPKLAAHMFVFYFGIISAITPPVAIASYTAAGIAKADLNKLSLWAIKLGLPAFIFPYMFIYGPELLFLPGENHVVRVIVGALIGTVCLAISLSGYLLDYLNAVQRVLLFSAGLLMISTTLFTDIVGILIMTAILTWHYVIVKKKKSAVAT